MKECPKSKNDKLSCVESSVYPYNAVQCNSNPSNIYDTHTMLGYCLPDIGSLERDYPSWVDDYKTAF